MTKWFHMSAHSYQPLYARCQCTDHLWEPVYIIEHWPMGIRLISVIQAKLVSQPMESLFDTGYEWHCQYKLWQCFILPLCAYYCWHISAYSPDLECFLVQIEMTIEKRNPLIRRKQRKWTCCVFLWCLCYCICTCVHGPL